MWKYAADGPSPTPRGDIPSDCPCTHVRNNICVGTQEDLHTLPSRPEFTFNKFYPGFDSTAAMCWMEFVYNVTHGLGGRGGHSLGYNAGLYSRLRHVEFNRLSEGEREAVRRGEMEFDCRGPVVLSRDVCGWTPVNSPTSTPPLSSGSPRHP